MKVVRKVGDAAFGDSDLEYGAIIDETAPDGVNAPTEETIMCRVVDKQQVIKGTTGLEITSTARLHCHINTAPVPVGSRVTLPPAYGNRELTVVATSRADGGGMPTPDHCTLFLE
ncbi:hypothetical protein HW450_06765 [Corynebacterium hindlerae]|uniref:Uncharacterized protein n=1 Tax=Corynebacterium hindlerae TaxID=699041 RepID=A0A7G5FBV1_9CORY|nr:hypothetical protein HW450_06765 [Corynebacterium hindlerae]